MLSSSKDPSGSASAGQVGITRRGFVGMAALAVGSIPLLGACTASSSPASRHATGTPKKGGVLHVGMTGGGSSESLDPGKLFNLIDFARAAQIYETAYTIDSLGRTIPVLVTEATPGPTGWKLRVRDGVTLHDGTPLTADDLAWTYNWILQASNGAYGRGALLGGRVSSARALDKTTVLVELNQPNFLLDQTLAIEQLSIFQNGTHPGAGGKFIGTGPFKVDRFAVGQRAVFSTNPHYWGTKPYLDGLEIVSVTDPNALVSAVQSGQVDAVASVAFEQLATFQNNPQFTVYNSPASNYNAHAMDTQTAPYNDPRVRKALRLLADRKQQLTNGVYGQGKIANDLSSWFDPYYAASLPQISYDPDQAKSLLRAAGVESATFELFTTNGVPGVVDSANLLAASANRAGVNVKVTVVPYDSYSTLTYLKAPFYSTNLGGDNISQTWNKELINGAPYPETHWNNAQWSTLYSQALASSDDGRRKSLMVDAQQILHDDTGYIVPVFTNNSDVASSRVGGLKSSPLNPLGAFDFRGAWIDN